MIALQKVCKKYGEKIVLHNIDLSIRPGEVHILLGENGAGKSTLIKAIAGMHKIDGGKILVRDKSVRMRSPQDAIDLGIATIYQELSLIPEMTVYENIFLGRERLRGCGFLNRQQMKKEAHEFLEQFGLDVSVDNKIYELGMGERQMVEIARAVSRGAQYMIMDEPTSSLSESEADKLLHRVENLKKAGIGILYISHKLEEIKRIGDCVTVLRDGAVSNTYALKEVTLDILIKDMVGREVKERYPRRTKVAEIGSRRLVVKSVRGANAKKFPGISFHAHQGEVLGIAGLVGAGRSEMARIITGIDRRASGSIFLDGEKLRIASVRDAIDAGIIYASEDRKEEGLFLDKSVEFNITLPVLFRNKMLHRKGLESETNNYIDELTIQPNQVDKCVGELSGGNQQKVIIARCLAIKAKVYFFDEPTRGVDVGAKVEIYKILYSLVEKGAIVVVISSDLPEILGICDRVLVMREGRITGDFLCDEVNQEIIMNAAAGG